MVLNSSRTSSISVRRISSLTSIIVTSTPKSAIEDANSVAITPPPIIASCLGNVSISKNVSVVSYFMSFNPQ